MLQQMESYMRVRGEGKKLLTLLKFLQNILKTSKPECSPSKMTSIQVDKKAMVQSFQGGCLRSTWL